MLQILLKQKFLRRNEFRFRNDLADVIVSNSLHEILMIDDGLTRDEKQEHQGSKQGDCCGAPSLCGGSLHGLKVSTSTGEELNLAGTEGGSEALWQMGYFYIANTCKGWAKELSSA